MSTSLNAPTAPPPACPISPESYAAFEVVRLALQAMPTPGRPATGPACPYGPLVRSLARRHGRELTGTTDPVDHLDHLRHLADVVAWELWLGHEGDPATVSRLFPHRLRSRVVDELRGLALLPVHHLVRDRARAAADRGDRLTDVDRAALAAARVDSLDLLIDGDPGSGRPGFDLPDPSTVEVEDLVTMAAVAIVREAVGRLDPLPRAIVCLYYLESDERRTDALVAQLLSEVGGAYGLPECPRWTGQYVGQVRRRALADLRAVLAPRVLRGCLDGGEVDRPAA